MGIKTDIGSKYAARKVTEEEDQAIKELASKSKKAYLWAKERYFAAREADNHKEKKVQPKREKGAPRKSMTIEQTKLGITMVISKRECRSLGFTGMEPTSQAIREIRGRLGLAEMGVRI